MPSKNEAQVSELGTWGEQSPASGVGVDPSQPVVRTDEVAGDDTRGFLKGLIESILFVTDHPLGIKELARAAKLDRRRAEELVEELRREHEQRGVRLEEVAGGFVLRSNPTYAEYVREFLAQRPVRLTRAQLETLAIIAYRQPITRPEIDDIRGVDSGPVLKGLAERDLIRILGKKDEAGRPMLYGTTPLFLELFSMHSLRDLPTLREFTELSNDSRREFERETGEEAPEGEIELESDEELVGGEAEPTDAPVSGNPAADHGVEDAAPESEDEDEDEDDDNDDEDDDEDDEDDEDEDDDDDD